MTKCRQNDTFYFVTLSNIKINGGFRRQNIMLITMNYIYIFDFLNFYYICEIHQFNKKQYVLNFSIKQPPAKQVDFVN